MGAVSDLEPKGCHLLPRFPGRKPLSIQRDLLLSRHAQILQLVNFRASKVYGGLKEQGEEAAAQERRVSAVTLPPLRTFQLFVLNFLCDGERGARIIGGGH